MTVSATYRGVTKLGAKKLKFVTKGLFLGLKKYVRRRQKIFLKWIFHLHSSAHDMAYQSEYNPTGFWSAEGDEVRRLMTKLKSSDFGHFAQMLVISSVLITILVW